MGSHPFLRRLTIFLGLLAPSFWPLPASGDPARTLRGGGRPPSRLETTVDPAISPGDDFFGYANGAWLRTAVIPAGKDRWSVRDEINELTATVEQVQLMGIDVLNWRYECLEDAGYPVIEAIALAERIGVDLHEACDLLAAGATVEQAVRILT